MFRDFILVYLCCICVLLFVFAFCPVHVTGHSAAGPAIYYMKIELD